MRTLALTATTALLAAAGPAAAQLTEGQVLVIYDSRVPDSLNIAEYYAGSSKVPGGAGGRPGAHPGVRVVNLAALAGAGVGSATATPDISYPDFIAKFRNPLRTYLDASGLTEQVRVITLTMGIPHRVLDTTTPGVGDNPPAAANALNAHTATYASLDSELCLLWQDLDTVPTGQTAKKSAGMITNPYWRAVTPGSPFGLPITAYSTRSIRVQKSYLGAVSNAGLEGIVWTGASASPSQRLTPGDIYLVCRLDGTARADVYAAIDRAGGRAGVTLNTETAAAVLDESNADSVQSVANNGELDNTDFLQNGGLLRAGDDYEQTRDKLLADGRLLPANVRYDPAAGPASFLVGPRVSYGGGIVVPAPVILLATEGNNHGGGTPGGNLAGQNYTTSFNYPPGAVFNSIESFNARDFNGLGTLVGQDQVSRFIASGGTFGVGNVWEPFSATIPDNLYLATNFILGPLSWAEAAYTSLPALSWQQIVVGDPLARMSRTRDDTDADGRTTVDDLYTWTETPTDLNRSGAADINDQRLLETATRGVENAWLPGVQR